MGFFKKIGKAASRLFGSSSAKPKRTVFEPANKKRTESERQAELENRLRKVRDDWDKFTEEARVKIEEEWRRVKKPDTSEEPEALEDDGRQYPVSGKEEDYTWTDWVPLISSNVDRIRIRKATHQLQVIFKNGALYQYEGVEDEIYDAFLNTHSPGQFVWGVLRAFSYPYAKLGTGNATSEPAAPRYDETPFAVPDWIEEVQAKAGRTEPTPLKSTKAPAGSNAPPKAPFTNQQPPKVPVRKGNPPARR